MSEKDELLNGDTVGCRYSSLGKQLHKISMITSSNKCDESDPKLNIFGPKSVSTKNDDSVIVFCCEDFVSSSVTCKESVKTVIE